MDDNMKIVGICGSPRDGASEYLLRLAIAKLDEEEEFESELFTVREKSISPCTHCNHCVENPGKCSIDDDMNEIYDALRQADGIIMASPVHFGSISAQLKAVIDRCQALQELAIQQINAFYMLNKIIPISGGSFGANLGACLWSQDSDAEGVKSDEYGLETLDMTINNFKEFLLEFHKMV